MTLKILNTVLTVGAIVAGISMATPAKANDNYCRDFNQKIHINGNYEQAYGRACLQPNGTWKIISSSSYDDDDDYETSHYKIKRTYTHAAPFRLALYWGDGHHYHGHGKHYKKRYRRHHAKHHYYKRGHKKHH